MERRGAPGHDDKGGAKDAVPGPLAGPAHGPPHATATPGGVYVRHATDAPPRCRQGCAASKSSWRGPSGLLRRPAGIIRPVMRRVTIFSGVRVCTRRRVPVTRRVTVRSRAGVIGRAVNPGRHALQFRHKPGPYPARLPLQAARRESGWCLSWALLHKSGSECTSRFPGQIYPTASVRGMPRVV